MTSSLREMWQALTRVADRVFDAFSVRPIGIVVFAASVYLLVYLQTSVVGSFRAEAVARAPRVDHPALVSSFVTAVYVQAGDAVESGAPLVELSSHFIDRELGRVDAEIEKLLHESSLAQARLLIEEQRWLSPQHRLRPDRPSLEQPTEALYALELAVLQTRRNQLLEDREALTVRSAARGRVVQVVPLGSSIAAGSSVAALSPEFAEELVAYVPADTNPSSIAPGVSVHITRPALACGERARVLRRGAAVEEAPGQLRSMLQFPLHGMPVYISIPDECRLGIGQVLTVEFPRASLASS